MYDHAKEIREARAAGEHALDCLYAARDQLSSARNWGVVDLLGGGLISGLMKHSKLENAEEEIEQARSAMHDFRDELDDIRGIGKLSLEIGDFLRFADIFFDGFFVDFMVQSRIREAQYEVDEAIGRVQSMLRRLNTI